MIIFAEFRFHRFILFISLFVVFSIIYLVICDDPIDFGGISVLQDTLRTSISEDIANLTRTEVPNIQENFIIKKDNNNEAVQEDIVQDIEEKAKKDKVYQKYTFTRWINMLYFSLSNTITMGYGDIYPISIKSKVIVCIQILLLLTILCLTK